MQHLHDDQYYIDLSDLMTIKACLKIIESWRKLYQEKQNDPEIKDLPKEEKVKGFQYYLNMELLVTQTNEYKRKQDRIADWKERDQKEQEKHDTTPPPSKIHCDNCNSLMHSTHRFVEGGFDEPLRVLFFFDCPKCKKRNSVYENGEVLTYEAAKCPKCKKDLQESHKRNGNVITWIKTCSCSYKNVEKEDLDQMKAEREKSKQEDKALLEKYREEFCLSDEKGKENIDLFQKMKYANEAREDEMRKFDAPVYQQRLQLKKLGIVDLEKLLTELIEKEKYIKFNLDKPEIGQFVIVPFTLQDPSKRNNTESVNHIQKLIKNALDDTNWRLVNNSVSFRLGYLSGQLKGYEREEDILELAGKKNKEEQPKSTFARNSTYEYDPMVQFARMAGKHEAIENLRKQRLINEPEGFFLDITEGPLTCAICRETTPGNNVWWTPKALYCADCWKNIKEGIIPPLTWDNDNKVWIKDWQLRSDYSIHGSTRKKLEKEGVLKGKHLKRIDGTEYCTLYLVAENKSFFEKYPKKPAMKIEFINTPKGKVQL